MRRISFSSAIFALLIATAAVVPASAQLNNNQFPTLGAAPVAGQQRLNESEQIRTWYRDYLGREPGPELTAWVELLRGGMSAVDVQATILGSDEFFNAQGRDPQTFVLESLQAVTWQAPNATLQRQWADRLSALRGDRFALAREILLTYGGAQMSSVAAPSEVSLQLTAAAKLLQDTANFELGGTLQGRQVTLRAKSLVDACMGLQRTVGVGNFRREDALAAARGVESSYNAVQSTLNTSPGAAPSTLTIARRIDSMLNDLQVALSSNPTGSTPSPGTTYPLPGTTTPLPGGQLPGPIVSVPAPSTSNGWGYDVDRVKQQLAGVARGTQSLIQLFSSQPSGNYTYRVALTDLTSFATQVDTMESTLTRGASQQKVQWDLQNLRVQADRLRPTLLAGTPPTFTRLFWTSVESGLDQMSESLGLPANGNTGVVPPPVMAKPNLDIVATCDQAVAQIDAFLTGVSPYVFNIPEVPRLQRDLRTIRNQVLTIRQMGVQQSPTSQVVEQVRLAQLQYSASYDLWSQIVEGYKLVNYTKLSPVGRSLTTIQETLTGVSADTNVYLRPGTPSRVDQLLTAFDAELQKYQAGLQPFQNFAEFRSLSLYADQLAAYSKTTRGLDVDRVRNLIDEQRQVAGMQRVMDLLESSNTQLEERANASTDRNALTYALELRRSLGRLSNYVNDLEYEVK